MTARDNEATTESAETHHDNANKPLNISWPNHFFAIAASMVWVEVCPNTSAAWVEGSPFSQIRSAQTQVAFVVSLVPNVSQKRASVHGGR